MWKDVPSYEGKYEASTEGHIRDKQTKELLKEYNVIKGDKHLTVYLEHSGNIYPVGVHRVIASTFVPNYSLMSTVHHKDFNPKHNRPSNLVWTSTSYNVALGNGRQPYVIRLYSKGSNLVKTYYNRVELLKDLGASKKDTVSVWGYLSTYLTDHGNREYTMSEVVFNYFKNSGYQKYRNVYYPKHISSSRQSARSGKGKVQLWVSTLSEKELAEVKSDLETLSVRKFKAKYKQDKRQVEKAINN